METDGPEDFRRPTVRVKKPNVKRVSPEEVAQALGAEIVDPEKCKEHHTQHDSRDGSLQLRPANRQPARRAAGLAYLARSERRV